MSEHIDATSLGIPSSRAYNYGKFGRIFPWLPPCLENTPKTRLLLAQLAKIMYERIGTSNRKLPAGYTYFGQFIAHDLSFDSTPLSGRQIDPEFLLNFRTPALDLDSIYGSGPSLNPFLYNPDQEKNNGKTHFWVDENTYFHSPNSSRNYLPFHDLPRTKSEKKTAIIADPRNDENIIISNLLVGFLRFHNRIVNKLDKTFKDKNKLFLFTQQLVRWHFQWIVLFDYLPKIIDLSDFFQDKKLSTNLETGSKKREKIIRRQIKMILFKENLRKFYTWKNHPFIPLEFSAAAFRFGHSQVVLNYSFLNHHNNENVDLRLFEKEYFNKKTPFARVSWKFL
ncbi:MAG: hypothetical protein KDD63_21305, partial [Bacteroidetes bacterium]|nr:hypothetical protein [Bacteroidota bacterium]